MNFVILAQRLQEAPIHHDNGWECYIGMLLAAYPNIKSTIFIWALLQQFQSMPFVVLQKSPRYP